MDEVIKLVSRYGDVHCLKPVNNEGSYQLIVDINCDYMRYGATEMEDEYSFVDPPGGPCIILGEVLEPLNRKVKKIKFDPKGPIITFEV